MERKEIVITGFGPFVGHEKVNASWEAVKNLPDSIDFNQINYKLKKVLVPVSYEAVDKMVDIIWNSNPELVIHCGVHGNAKNIHLEKIACNTKFNAPDIYGKILSCPTICLEKNGEDCKSLATKIDVDQIVNELNALNDQIKMFTCSNDVGFYLCGYIYLKSLDKNCKKCLFIHVPPVNQPYTTEETSSAIVKVIIECLKQISNKI